MINGERVLAVVPARGGSKRCPGKNLKDFRGKPLLQWTLEAGRGSKYIDRIVLSTENHEIKELALKLGYEVVDRLGDLASDTAASEDVMRSVLRHLPNYNWMVLLQPTSPLRLAEDIDSCIEKAQGDMGCVSYRGDTFGKNGAVYVCHSLYLERGYNFDRPFRSFYVMPPERSLDIDYPEEFNL